MLKNYNKYWKSVLEKSSTYLKKHGSKLKISLVFLSFAIPFSLLYYLDAPSFDQTWKGRTFYLFFVWLFIMELILDWEKYSSETAGNLSAKNLFVLITTSILPTVYVVIANYYGLNMAIASLAGQYKIHWNQSMPLSTEYLVFMALFSLVLFSAYKSRGLKDFSLSIFFLGIIGVIYTIDNIYPGGNFTPFQIFVPTTAMFAERLLNLIGYQTMWMGEYEGAPVLRAWNSKGEASFGIAWPCSGVESFLIYIITILLFLKKTAIPWKQKAIYFIIGAVVTYFINILRIVTIFVIAINNGSDAAWVFHNYYGLLYSVAWIMSYPMIIIGSQILLKKIKSSLKS